MASIGKIDLDIKLLGGGKARALVKYAVNFDQTDVACNLPYKEVCRLIGDDTNVGDVATGGDDVIPNGLVLAGEVQPNGQPTVSRDLVLDLPQASLDEDNVGNDEIRATVTLTPKFTFKAVSRESNLIKAAF